jgi:hypothetical protein
MVYINIYNNNNNILKFNYLLFIIFIEIQHAISRGERFVTPYLVLRVSRERILSDTLSELFRYQTSDYKKPLKVVFDDEDGIDAGGVRKEFYQLMLKQLLDVGYGMFKYYPESRYLWFKADSYESTNEFELVGLLLGVAIYNSIIIDLQMPSAVYKKLKNEKMTLTDLEELEPSLAQGLKRYKHLFTLYIMYLFNFIIFIYF